MPRVDCGGTANMDDDDDDDDDADPFTTVGLLFFGLFIASTLGELAFLLPISPANVFVREAIFVINAKRFLIVDALFFILDSMALYNSSCFRSNTFFCAASFAFNASCFSLIFFRS